MRDDFRQLTNRLMRIFERKCFYARSGESHGKAPVIKRGPKPIQRPPADYAEQQKVHSTGLPKGFQPLSAYQQLKHSSQKSEQLGTQILAGTTTNRNTPLGGDALNEPVDVPHELGVPRLQAFEHNKRMNIRKIVNDAFASRDQEPESSLYHQEALSSRETTVPRTSMSGVPPGPSKTLRHQRSAGNKAMRMIASNALRPEIDPTNGQYVIQLDEFRAQKTATVQPKGYVPRLAHTLQEMVYSARTGAHLTPITRPAGARVSRIDQAPRFTYNSSSSAAQQHQYSSLANTTRAPFLRNATTTQAGRRHGDVISSNTIISSPVVGREERAYPRSHSSGRPAEATATPSLYRRSASSGRSVVASVAASAAHAEGSGQIGENHDDLIGAAPALAVENQAPATLSKEKRTQLSDQNASPRMVKDSTKSNPVVPPVQKRVVLYRDEFGQLRRVQRLPDGTLAPAKRRAPVKLSEISSRMEPKVTVERIARPTAGTVYAMHSMARREDKQIGKQGEQKWKKSQASVAPWGHNASVLQNTSAFNQGVNTHDADADRSLPRLPTKSKRKDALNMDYDDDVVLRSKRPLSRLCVVPALEKTEEEKQASLQRLWRRLDEENAANVAIDIVTEDTSVLFHVKNLIASLPPLDSSENNVEQTTLEKKKAGRPPKKFRGRFAREKQAIRDAVNAEKEAIKQRELPVLDLALKVIEDPTVVVPAEAPIVIDALSAGAIDTAVLHEVGELLKEIVAQVSLDTLEPKREGKVRSRRCWEHLPGRGRSKRQEEKAIRAAAVQEQDIVMATDLLTSNQEQSDSPAVVQILEAPFPQTSTTTFELKTETLPSTSWDEEFPTASFDDVGLNDEDLVDINVDTFFTAAETDSVSGDEGETPSQKMRNKFRNFLHQPSTIVPSSCGSGDHRTVLHDATFSIEPPEEKSAHFRGNEETEDVNMEVCAVVHDLTFDVVRKLETVPVDSDFHRAKMIDIVDVAQLESHCYEEVIDDLVFTAQSPVFRFIEAVLPTATVECVSVETKAAQLQCDADPVAIERDRQDQEGYQSVILGLPVTESCNLSLVDQDATFDLGGGTASCPSECSAVGVFPCCETGEGEWAESYTTIDCAVKAVEENLSVGFTNVDPVEYRTALSFIDKQYYLDASPSVSFENGTFPTPAEETSSLHHAFNCSTMIKVAAAQDVLQEMPISRTDASAFFASSSVYVLECCEREETVEQPQIHAVRETVELNVATKEECLEFFLPTDASSLDFSSVKSHVECKDSSRLRLIERRLFDSKLSGEEFAVLKDVGILLHREEDVSRPSRACCREFLRRTHRPASLPSLSSLHYDVCSSRPVSVNIHLPRPSIKEATQPVLEKTCSVTDKQRVTALEYSANVQSESKLIQKYLCSQEPYSSGLSSVTDLERAYLDSPDLFSCSSDRIKQPPSRKRSGSASTSAATNNETPVESLDDVVEGLRVSKFVSLRNEMKNTLNLLLKGAAAPVERFGPLVKACRHTKMHCGSPSPRRYPAIGIPGAAEESCQGPVPAAPPPKLGRDEHTGPGSMAPIPVNLLRKNDWLFNGLFASKKLSSIFIGRNDQLKVRASMSINLSVSSVKPRSHLISDFTLALIKPMNPVVDFTPEIVPQLSSTFSFCPLRLSRYCVEGSLERALDLYERGVDCILQQISYAKEMIQNIRSTTHWSLQYLMDAQLFLMGVVRELWEYTARSVQLALFSSFQCCLWEKHHQVFEARMCSLLFEMNAAAALSVKVVNCCSYVKRFEEWNRKCKNFSSVYNHVFGLALSIIKLIAIPNALKRLQSSTHWDSKPRPWKSTNEIFFVDLVPFFQLGTLSFNDDDPDVEKLLEGWEPLDEKSLDRLLSGEIARDNNHSNNFSFLFPSYAVLEVCRRQIDKEVNTFFAAHKDSVLSGDRHQMYLLSPTARAIVLSRSHVGRAKSLMRNNIINLDKLIVKANTLFDELSVSTRRLEQAEFHYPCGQMVFDFERGKVVVSENELANKNEVEIPMSLKEEAKRIMEDLVQDTVFCPSSPTNDRRLLAAHDPIQNSVELVKNWVMTIPVTYDDVEQDDSHSVDMEDESVETICEKHPARVTVIDDNDIGDPAAPQEAKSEFVDTVMTTIAGHRIQYAIDDKHGLLKMKTATSGVNYAATDELSVTNTLTTASFNSLDQIETLNIIRDSNTGELNWLAMIEHALEATPTPETLPSFLQKNQGLTYQTMDIMDAHERANHFVRETSDKGEFLDLRKDRRDQIRQFQKVDYFERRRSARYEAIGSDKPLEMSRPPSGEVDKVPQYGIWVQEVAQYADIERKRLMQLKPINNVGRCRAARSEAIREFELPVKRRKRPTSAPVWSGRTLIEHFGEYLSFGMARLEFENNKQNGSTERIDSKDDTITHYFISRNNSPSTIIDPLELLADPYARFRPTSKKRRRANSPLLESSLVKSINMNDSPIFAPFASLESQPPLKGPLYSDCDSSDDEDD
ncbi:unnamed protein product [Nippostrongylus brasiliensis]|uniref:Uncharacterized protein n=1 Tax=Nippostrongylus brasiliensis TaxID=27835 RepID=A0A158R1S2_NIPBR|nr:unnamed protein product [Nippostrongylus brasiliensis]